MNKILPSIICADLLNLEREILEINNSLASRIHIDVMDGSFVENITMGHEFVKYIKNISKIELDIHLMVMNPDRQFEKFISAGSDYISFHIEASSDAFSSIKLIKNISIKYQKSVKIGIAISPNTNTEALIGIINHIDYIIVMTVEPGMYGQSMISDCLTKIKNLENIRSEMKLDFEIVVDGGVNFNNISFVKNYKPDAFVVGSAVFNTNINNIGRDFISKNIDYLVKL
jgi:ribulose-phosphate 3-epimerase